MHGNFREYLDPLLRDGYNVRHDEHLSDPDLIDPGGNPVETWREEYPYGERLDRDIYEREKYQLQIELLKFQYWAQDTGTKHVILCEGRDAAGKGGTIKRFMEHLNPRAARVVALTRPTETESNDKKRARINAMRFFLSQFDYEGKDASVVYPGDTLVVQRGRDSIRD